MFKWRGWSPARNRKNGFGRFLAGQRLNFRHNYCLCYGFRHNYFRHYYLPHTMFSKIFSPLIFNEAFREEMQQQLSIYFLPSSFKINNFGIKTKEESQTSDGELLEI